MTLALENPLRAAGYWPLVVRVAREHRVRVGDILSRDRRKKVSDARIAIYVLMRHTLVLSYPRIGELLGRDHTSVMAAVHDFEARLAREYEVEAAE